jgi:hypothetical protein
MGEGRRRFAVAVALAVVGAACTSGGGGTATPPATTTTVSTKAGVTTTTLDPTKAAILAAYRASWADYIAVAETFPVKPLDPRLAQHDTGTELTGDRKALTQLSVLGHYNVGPTDLAPVVTSSTGNSAVVSDCVFDHSFEVDARTKSPVEQPDVGHTLYRFEMSRINDTWYVSDSTMLKSGKTEDACSPTAA